METPSFPKIFSGTHVATLPHHWKSILARGWDVFFFLWGSHMVSWLNIKKSFKGQVASTNKCFRNPSTKRLATKNKQHTLAGCKVNILPQKTNMNTKISLVERNVLFQSIWCLGSGQSFSGAYSPWVKITSNLVASSLISPGSGGNLFVVLFFGGSI